MTIVNPEWILREYGMRNGIDIDPINKSTILKTKDGREIHIEFPSSGPKVVCRVSVCNGGVSSISVLQLEKLLSYSNEYISGFSLYYGVEDRTGSLFLYAQIAGSVKINVEILEGVIEAMITKCIDSGAESGRMSRQV